MFTARQNAANRLLAPEPPELIPEDVRAAVVEYRVTSEPAHRSSGQKRVIQNSKHAIDRREKRAVTSGSHNSGWRYVVVTLYVRRVRLQYTVALWATARHIFLRGTNHRQPLHRCKLFSIYHVVGTTSLVCMTYMSALYVNVSRAARPREPFYYKTWSRAFEHSKPGYQHCPRSRSHTLAARHSFVKALRLRSTRAGLHEHSDWDACRKKSAG